MTAANNNISSSVSAPNILLFVSDQQHYTCAPGSCPANLHIPNLHWLAQRGTVFDRAYCTSPLCTPARGSILTGRTPSELGIVANYNPGAPLYSFDSKFRTIGDYLAESGYDTAYSGKWHLPTGSARPGFASVLGRMTHWDMDRSSDDDAIRQAAEWGVELGPEYRSYLRKDPLAEPQQFHGRSTTLPLNAFPGFQMAQLSSTWIRERKGCGKPFFLTYSCIEPHPLGLRYDIAPAPFDRMYRPEDFDLPQSLREETINALLERGRADGLASTQTFTDDEMRALIAGYMGAVSYTDFLLGVLLEALVASGEMDNTVIIFTSDHGEMLGNHGMLKKGPVMYEDLIRVPLVIAHGNGHMAPRRETTPVSHLDLLPTIVDPAGRGDADGRWAGRSLTQSLDGSRSLEDRPVTVEYHSITWGDKVIPLRARVETEWKLVVDPDGPIGLYNLVDDPGERVNRIEDTPAVLSRMNAALLDDLASANDPWPDVCRPQALDH